MAGSITYVHYPPAPCVGVIVATITGDASDGTVPTTPLPVFEGRLLALITDPGTPAPTDNYDLSLPDAGGFDRAGGAGANRDTATTERAAITDGYVSRHEQVSLAVANQAVASAVVVVTIHYTTDV